MFRKIGRKKLRENKPGIRYLVLTAMPPSFILVGTMNPEELELKPSLIDKFRLYVEVENV